ncbi:PDIA3 [Cordylochernes scorpioides]|uniref:Protein disulfide-isomerase n=1 Tax=Cordylochernes scorpioides TaxID=51811 RepID=A0ABY6LFZ2_9ARAC|nr:PDIA3 [Cordylochernes scorpioides]
MKSLFILFFIFGLAFSSDVIDLSGSDFDERIKELDTALVEFYAPWCGHCKRLGPKYEEAASILKKSDPAVPLVKVDCTSETGGKDTCSKYGVGGYPTLKIFRGGEFSSEYNGGRETDAIVKYMKAQVGPSSKLLKSQADLDKLLAQGETIIAGLFKSEGSSLEQEYLKIADKQREQYVFAHTYEESLLKSLGHDDEAVVIIRPKQLHNKFEPSSVKYDGSGGLEKYIRTSYHGLVGIRNHDNYKDFETPLLVAYYDVDYVKNPKGTNYWRNRIMKVAQDYAKKLNFAVSNREAFMAELEKYGWDSPPKDKPVVAIRDAQERKYRMEDDFSMDNLRKYLEAYEAGELTPYLKSESVPENNDGPVKVAVAKNFQELVTDSEKDVLIEFYAPWCGHCKKLAPTFEELGTAMKGENVEIVKMDATANDVPPPFEVSGFPTIYYLPKNKKSSPVPYHGGRELEDFIKYLAREATSELKGYDRKGNQKKSEL